MTIINKRQNGNQNKNGEIFGFFFQNIKNRGNIEISEEVKIDAKVIATFSELKASCWLTVYI